MNTINLARTCDGVRIKVVTSQSGSNLLVGFVKAGAPFLSSPELRRNRSVWYTDSWRADNQDCRYGHTGFDRRDSDFMNQCGNALSCRPSVVVGMAKLEIVGSQHQDEKG